MNGKTVKVLKRYSLATGIAERSLKREWLALDARHRFEKRQEMLQALKKKMSSKAPSPTQT